MEVIIFSGQSNMQGQTEANPMDEEVKGAKEYKFLTNSLVPLKNPVGEDIEQFLLGSHLGHGSLVPYFCEKYIEQMGKEVIAVHVAKGATIISQWLKSNNQEKRYDKMIEKINGALNVLTEKPEKIHLIWLQGESDALAKTTKDDYKKMLTEFKEDLKKDIGIDSFGIIQVGYFASNFGNKDCDEIIQQAQFELCNEDKDFKFLTDVTKELSLDSKYINPEAVGHFNNQAMKIIGRLAGEALAKLEI